VSTSEWVAQIVNRLNAKIVHHRNYSSARARLHSALLVRQPGEAIALTGPSRGGKTSIVKEVARIHNPEDERSLMARRPVVLIRARNKSDKGQFTTRAFYLNALKAIRHPFFVLTGEDLVRNADLIRRMHNDSNDVLCDILENALEILGVKYLIIDEAQHIRYMVGKDVTASQVLESLKTLAEAIGCVIVFVGAYPILPVLKLAPHIVGRDYIVDIPRYRAGERSDMLAFEQTLQWFSKDIKFASGVKSLRDWNDLLFDGSLGVPGLLNAWVRNALSEMLARGDSRLGLEHIRFARKPGPDDSELLSEIEAGEEYLAEWDYKESPEPAPNEGADSKGKKKGKSKGKPFQAKPKRRAAGGRA